MILHLLEDLMPLKLHYKGFQFGYKVYQHPIAGFMVAFVVEKCEAKTKLKKEAFKKGYWDDPEPQNCISSYGTPWLIAELVGMVEVHDDDFKKGLIKLAMKVEKFFNIEIPSLHQKINYNQVYHDVDNMTEVYGYLKSLSSGRDEPSLQLGTPTDN